MRRRLFPDRIICPFSFTIKLCLIKYKKISRSLQINAGLLLIFMLRGIHQMRILKHSKSVLSSISRSKEQMSRLLKSSTCLVVGFVNLYKATENLLGIA